MKKALLAGLCSLAAVAGTLAVASACSNNKGVTELSFDPNNMPQTNIVQGNDLDLSGSRLIADGSIVLMDSADVQVTGYDKTKLGQQTLEVTYGGKTIPYTINVVPRFQTASTPVYFVGDEFADAKPVIMVWYDNGTSVTLNGDYSSLSIANFSTDSALDNLSLQITYTADGVTYKGELPIEVYEPTYLLSWENQEIVCESHIGELNTAGWQLTITNNEGYSRYTDMATDVTFSGVDFDVVGPDKEEVTQTVEVLYKGRDTGKSFDVTIVYSDVSRFLDFAETCPEADEWVTPDDWGENEEFDYPAMYMPESITDEMGEDALDLLQLYENMRTADRNYISQNALEAVGRVGVMYGYNKWFKTYYADEELMNAVYIDNGGYAIYLYSDESDPDAGTIEAYLTASKKLLNEDGTDATVNELERISGILAGEAIRDKLSDTDVYADMESPMDSLFRWNIKDRAYLQSMGYTLSHAVEAYEILKDFATPDEGEHAQWMSAEMRERLTENAETIEAAYKELTNVADRVNGQASPNDGGINPYISYVFYAINDFTKKDDYFEILYRYYFYRAMYTLDPDSPDYDDEMSSCSAALSNLVTFYIPGPVNDLALNYQMTELLRQELIYNAEEFAESGEDAIGETTAFMVAFNETQKLTQEFIEKYITTENTEDADVLYYYLYDKFGLLSMFNELYYGEYGYTQLLTSATYDNSVLGVWTIYTDLYLQFIDDQTLLDPDNTSEEAAAFGAKVDEMFKAFAELEPIQQYRFINSLNYLYYDGSPQVALIPDSTGYLGSLFAQFAYTYYYQQFGVESGSTEYDTSETIFLAIMCAIENHMNGDADSFCYYMTEARKAYEGEWTGNCTKEKFDELLGDVYDKNIAYLDMFTASGEGEEATFEYDTSALTDDDLATLSTLNRILGNAEKSAYSSYSQYTIMSFIASFEQARTMIEAIDAESALGLALRNMPYNGGATLYSRYYDILGQTQLYLDELGVSYALYMDDTLADMRGFISEYAEYYYTATTATIELQSGGLLQLIYDYADGEPALTADYISGMLAKFLALDADSRSALIMCDSNLMLFNGMLLCIDFTEVQEGITLPDLLNYLVNSYIYSIYYESSPDAEIDGETITELFVQSYESYTEAYGSLSDDLKAEFDGYFAQLEDATESLYEEAKASLEENGSAAA